MKERTSSACSQKWQIALDILHFTEAGTEKIELALGESLEATILWGLQSSFSGDNRQ